MRSALQAAFVAALGLSVAVADEKKPDGKTPAEKKADDKPYSDEMFVKMAASGGMLEVKAGVLAQDKTANADVRAFGAKMVTDHTKAGNELKAAAKVAGIKVPDTLLDEHQKHLDHLKDMKKDDFDKAYIHHMVADHEEDVALFEKASKEAKDKNIKTFAEKTLPTIKEHLAMAKKIHDSMKSDKK